MAPWYRRRRPLQPFNQDLSAGLRVRAYTWKRRTDSGLAPVLDLGAARARRDATHVEGMPKGPWPGDKRPIDDEGWSGWPHELPIEDDPAGPGAVMELRRQGGAS